MNLKLSYSIRFATTANADGSYDMEVTDGESGQSYSLFRTKPEGVVRENRIVLTPKGKKFQTGVVVKDGRGLGVAWPVTEVVTDEELAAWETGLSVGHRNAAPMLKGLSPQDRWTVVEEAKLRMAYNAGWNFSGAVSQAVAGVRNGETPCLDRWREEMVREAEAEAWEMHIKREAALRRMEKADAEAEIAAEMAVERYYEDRGYEEARAQEAYEMSLGITYQL